MSELKIRASQVGKLMSNSRTKGEISKTAQTYLQELAVENTFGIKKQINSRYLQKGNECEDASIELAERVLELGFIYKNELFFENDWIKGTPDVITDKLILDVKTSWSIDTFPFFETDIPNKDYYWQLQAYMWLTDRDNAILAYCLVDTPLTMVEDEIRRESWAKKEISVTEETENEVRARHEFSHIDEKLRVKAFLIERNESDIEAMKSRIEEARVYYNELINKLK